MQAKEFKYYLRKRLTPTSYVYYFINSLGSVTTTGTKTELEYAPDGWMESALEWKRGFEYWGVFTTMSQPLRFVRDGAKILRYVYYTEGIQGNCELYIERLDRSSGNYNLYYRGELDFNQVSDENSYITINVMEGGYLESLRSRENTVYEIDLDTNPDYFYVKMDGIKLQANVEYFTVDEAGTPFPTLYTNFDFRNIIQPTITLNKSDNSDIVGYVNSQIFTIGYIIGATGLQWDTNQYIFESRAESSVIADFDFRVAVVNDSVGSVTSQPDIKLIMFLFIINDKGKSVNPPAFSYTTPLWQPQSAATSIYNMNFSTPAFTIKEGEKLSLGFAVITPTGYALSTGNKWAFAVERGDIKLNFETIVRETYIKALRPETVFENLVENIGEGNTNANAGVLASTFKDYVLTSGDGLRGLLNAKIKTSFNDFYTSYNNIFNLATFYDKSTNTHHIVDKDSVFDNGTTLLSVGSVNDLKISPLKEQIFSSFDIGYPEIRIEGLNGKEAFNCKFEWDTPITKNESKKDLLSKYIADPFTMEIHRANLYGKDSTDSDEDNEVFLLHIEDTSSGTYLGKPLYELYRNPSLVVNSGLTHPNNMYNIEFSPKRNLIRNSSYLYSILHLMDTKYIKFQTADRNQELSTTLGAITITENEDVLISTLSPRIFLPIIAEFNCVIPINAQSILDSNSYGLITFDWQGETYGGFLYEVTENPATRASQTIKLILSPSTDLTKLIN